MDFGSALRCAREKRGLSQNALAKAAGLDASYIHRLERGDREAPRRDTVMQLAAALALRKDEVDTLLVAAGQFTEAVYSLGPADRTLCTVADALGNPALTESRRHMLRMCVEAICAGWSAVGDELRGAADQGSESVPS